MSILCNHEMLSTDDNVMYRMVTEILFENHNYRIYNFIVNRKKAKITRNTEIGGILIVMG